MAPTCGIGICRVTHDPPFYAVSSGGWRNLAWEIRRFLKIVRGIIEAVNDDPSSSQKVSRTCE